uniref:Uncharacterized protein n=1 Tax=Oryza sativa subsp. japonica TaxID=39947 RepID=Q6EQ01_ORYSJ|nr:hypothetical protein [Oryza sativa Japonica Group]
MRTLQRAGLHATGTHVVRVREARPAHVDSVARRGGNRASNHRGNEYFPSNF